MPEIVRFSWKTSDNLLNSIGCRYVAKSRFRDLGLGEYQRMGFERGFLSNADVSKGEISGWVNGEILY